MTVYVTDFTIFFFGNKPKLFALMLIQLLFVHSSFAQVREFKLDISKVQPIAPNELTELSGSDPSGNKLSANSYYISKNLVPFIPVTAEFHFSRYPEQYWDESIKKIKAGGVNTIATYIFWNIHEEKEAVFDWTGNRNLRKFIKLCAENSMMVMIRIGPFDHGEIRNGGLPDWLLSKPLTVRDNDPEYLHYVELLYNQIAGQLRGLYFKDGGPIIGTQIENEYQHSASPWGLTYPGQPYDFTVADRDRSSAKEGVSVASADNPYANLGDNHMKVLKALAQKAGITTPFYTATGWGYAAIIENETLPVTAAYAYPTWTTKNELSPFYLFTELHKKPDYSPVRYDPLRYPAFSAELGSGIMSTYSRRPIVPAESVDALINRTLGSGANGIGYYMFHGGSTPIANQYFFNDEAYGYPKISYDFQAPIGEYGQINPSFNRLKLLHFFINDFGDVLAKQITVLPKNAAGINPESTDLRYAARTDGKSGFLFINNFQDHFKTPDQTNLRITIEADKETISIPQSGSFSLKSGENIIMPFNLDINGNRLVYSTAQLLTKSDKSDRPFYIFFYPEGTNAELSFANKDTRIRNLKNASVLQYSERQIIKCSPGSVAEFTISSSGKKETNVLVIPKKLALKAQQVLISGIKHLVFSDALLLNDNEGFQLLSTGNATGKLEVYPKITRTPTTDVGTIKKISGNTSFTGFAFGLPAVKLSPDFKTVGQRKLFVNLPTKLPAGLNDVFLTINYTGDTGMSFLNGELVADDFYKGVPWQIGLKRFISPGHPQMAFYFRPIFKDAPYLMDLPDAVNKQVSNEKPLLKINSVSFIPEYKTNLKF
ncbi:hypothetical protein GS399_15055 [Pedobacter sp. HMF7647]|uniref:Beta-galactosidase n=1 Tax=Hufsiella arboris TaxID=2695275 RepID=A0A7K1YCJ9_9SPHI|nr:beta-galactosidase [Hufsiella arboris]MXV52295.1 hypothetical protein [Hufsiella arboris]